MKVNLTLLLDGSVSIFEQLIGNKRRIMISSKTDLDTQLIIFSFSPQFFFEFKTVRKHLSNK